MKIIAHVNGIPIEQLTDKQKEDFKNYVLRTFEEAGYKVHKKKDTK